MNETKNESFLEVRAVFERIVHTEKGNDFAVFHTYASNSPLWIKLKYIDEDIADILSDGDVVSVRVSCMVYNGSAFLTYRVLGIVTRC